MAKRLLHIGGRGLKQGSIGLCIEDDLPAFSLIYDLAAGANASFANNAAQNILYDSSGNDNHAIQNTVANQPVHKKNIVNGRPSLTFDGANDFMNLSAIVRPRTIFAVLKHNVLNGNYASFISNNTTGTTGNQQVSYFGSQNGNSLFFRNDTTTFFGDNNERNRAWSGLAQVSPAGLLRTNSFRVLCFLVRGSGEGIAEINSLASRFNSASFDAVEIAYLAISEQKFTDAQIIQHINTLKTQFAL